MNCNKNIMAIMLISGLISPLIAGENTWTTNGPAGGTVYTIEINPLDRDKIYIGTISNGIYKTTDGGGNWQHLDNNNLFVCMRDIAIHPVAPDTMFAATVKGLYKSTDAGATWSFVQLPMFPYNEVEVVQYHPAQPGLVFAGTPVDAWRSTDGGASWEAMDIPPLTGMIHMKIAPGNPDLIYFLGTSMYTDRGVWKSEDRGFTWTNVHNNIELIGSGTDIDIDPDNNDIVYIAVDNLLYPEEPCIYRTIDGGANWVDISPLFLVDHYVLSMAVSPIDHRVIYAATGDNGVIKSEDYGDTWIEFNAGIRTRHMVTIEIDTVNLIMYLGTIYDGIYKKPVNGGTWQSISSNIFNAECFSIDICSSNIDRAYVVAANGIFRTEDMGGSWSYVDIGLPVGNIAWDLVFDRYQPDRLYACSVDNTFVQVGPAPTGFYLSNDNGATWAFLNDGLPDTVSYARIKISYLGDDSRRIFLGSTRGLYYSDNSGATWEICDNALPSNLSYIIVEVSPSDPYSIVAANSSYNHMFISNDRGDSWTELEIPHQQNAHITDVEFSPDDADHIFITIYFMGLFESLDGGQNWTDITNDLPIGQSAIAISGITINPSNTSNLFVASSHRGIFQTHNGGQNWESFNAGLDTTGAYGKTMFAPGDTTKLYFAASARSVWTITRTPTDIDGGDQTLPAQFTSSAYPNPFNAHTTIRYSLPDASSVTLDIYDLLGRKVQTLYNGPQPPGEHSLIWSADGFSSGIYFYKLTAGEYEQTDKMMLVK